MHGWGPSMPSFYTIALNAAIERVPDECHGALSRYARLGRPRRATQMKA
jgi:hypothetical protein